MRWLLFFFAGLLMSVHVSAFQDAPSQAVVTDDITLGEAYVYLTPRQSLGLYTLKNISDLYSIKGLQVSVVNEYLEQDELKKLVENPERVEQVRDDTPRLSMQERAALEEKIINFDSSSDPQNAAKEYYKIDKYPMVVFLPVVTQMMGMDDVYFKFNPTNTEKMKEFQKMLVALRINPLDPNYIPDITNTFHYCDYFPEEKSCAEDFHQGTEHQH